MILDLLKKTFVNFKPVRPAMLDLDRPVDFASVAASCRKQNEFNRLIIKLENTLTPAEIAAIAELELPPEVNERAEPWLARLRKWRPEIFLKPQSYQRRSIGPAAIFYSDGSLPRREKKLLVAFGGNALRLMVPTCVFLQGLCAKHWDVLFVRKQDVGTSYFDGQDGIASDFSGVIRYFEVKISRHEYRCVNTLGTSSGGFFAIWAGSLLGAKRAFSLAGFLPRKLPDVVFNKTVPSKVHFYGEDNPVDRDTALAMREYLGGELRSISHVAHHNLLGTLMKEGRLGEIFCELQT